MKQPPALAFQERFHFVEFQSGVLDERMVHLNDVKTKADVVGTMAGQRVKTDFNPFDAPGLPGGGLFFNGVNNGTDKGDFVHSIKGFSNRHSLPEQNKVKSSRPSALNRNCGFLRNFCQACRESLNRLYRSIKRFFGTARQTETEAENLPPEWQGSMLAGCGGKPAWPAQAMKPD